MTASRRKNLDNTKPDRVPPRTTKKARAAATAREANDRWGLAGRTWRSVKNDLAAYTAEDFSADIAAGVVPMVRRACPGRFGEDCRPGAVPQHYRSTSTTVAVDAAGDVPRRWRTSMREICYDCRISRWWQERREFCDDFGDELSARLGFVSFGSIADWGETARVIDLQHHADKETIAAVGQLEEVLEWFDVRILAATIRRCLAGWSKISTPQQPPG